MDSPEPFLFRLALHALVSLASAAFVPVDLALDVQAAVEARDGTP